VRIPQALNRALKRIALGFVATALVGLGVVSVVVERESGYVLEPMGGVGEAKGLVLYHPSRDAHFSDDLSLAAATGLWKAGLTVERATMTGATPAEPADYAIIVVVSNTYYWSPDLPTLRYLRRARFDGIPVLGIIGGAGATARSERLLHEALLGTGGRVLSTRSFWLLRPNDEARMAEPNRAVAVEGAEIFALAIGRTVSRDAPGP
jgi:hypothetical protein